MGNAFDVNKQVAVAFVRSEQIKGWFLANAKLLLIVLSGAMMFCGVVALAWGDRKMSWESVAAVTPFALVAALLAICIEGGTIFSSAMRKEVVTKIKQEVTVLDKVKSKLGSEEYEERKRKVQGQRWVPNLLMAVCVIFSVTGAEIFWQKLFDGSAWYFHVIGGVLGVVCSALLIVFELNAPLVERVIEKCIRSSGLTMIALDQSAMSQIHDALFSERERKLRTPEFRAILTEAAEQGLLGVVSNAVAMTGATVSGEQLKRMVEEEREARDAAEEFIASGGQMPVKQLSAPTAKQLGRRVTKNRKAVVAALKQYGESRIMNDPDQYAADLGMDRRTMERWIEDIRQNGM